MSVPALMVGATAQLIIVVCVLVMVAILVIHATRDITNLTTNAIINNVIVIMDLQRLGDLAHVMDNSIVRVVIAGITCLAGHVTFSELDNRDQCVKTLNF